MLLAAAAYRRPGRPRTRSPAAKMVSVPARPSLKPPSPASAPEATGGTPDSTVEPPTVRRLDQVPEGRRVRIVSLPSHQHLRERLKALGIRPGVVVQVVRRGRPGGILHLAHGPLEFMLRRQHAAEIEVTPEALSGT